MSQAENGRGERLGEDVPAFREELRRLRLENGLLRARTDLLDAVTSGKPLADVLSDLVVSIERYRPGSTCSILFLDAGRGRLFLGSAPGLPEDYKAAIADGVPVGPSSGSCGTAAFRREAVIVSDISADPLWAGRAALAESFGLRSCWSTPFFSTAGEVLGTFGIYHGEPQVPEPADLDLIDAAGRLASLAVERSREQEARRRAEAEVREKAETLSGILSASVDHLYVVGGDGRYRYVSEGGARVLGFEPAAVVGRHWRELGLPAEVMGPFDAVRDEAIRSGRALRRETTFPAADGERHFEYVVAPLSKRNGATAVVVVSRDVTESRRQGRLLDRYRLLSENARDIVLFVRPDGRIVEANEAAVTAYGYDRETLLSMTVAELRDPATVDLVPRQLAEAAEAGVRFESVHRRRDGTTFAVEVGSRGAFVGGERLLLSVVRDISDRKRAEEELGRQRKLLHAIAENADSALVTVDAAGRLTFVNPAFTRMTGYSAAEVIGRGVHETIHWKLPDGRPFPAVECPLDEAVRSSGAAVLHREDAFVRKDGTVFPVVVSIAPIEEEGRVVGCVGEFRDVTAEKASEAALVRNEQVSRFLADAGAALAELSGLDETLRRVAALAVPRFADWCAIDLFEGEEFRRAAVVHSDPAKVELAHEFHRRFPPDPDGPAGLWKILRTSEPDLIPEITEEMIEAVGDAERRRMLWELGLRSYIGVPLKVRDEVLGVVTFVSAESARRFDERDLALAQDLARRAATAIENVRLYEGLRDADRRKNEFLAMLGHELRNPLAPIRSGLDLLKMSGAEPEVVDLMSGQVEHLVRLVDDLLDVSRILRGRVELKRQAVDLGEVVRRAVETVRPMFEAQRQEFAVRPPAGPVRLEADPVRLAQVLTNLLSNASKYTEAEGRISLDAERQEADLVLRVSDTGIGIDPDLLPHVFELFTQSTRSIDRSQGGLGIGLTIVKNLVEMHGGTVTVRSEGFGRGSEFVVRLPIAEAAVPEAAAVSPGPSDSRRRVLVVDDNVPAAKLLVRLLGKLGPYEVVTAHDGEGALAAAGAYRPDLVLLDLGLPKLDGYQVCRRLRSDPAFDGTLLVALTGYGTEEDRRRSAEAGFDRHVTKPPSIETLRAVLADAKLEGVRAG